MNEHKERGTITKILSKEFEKWAFGLDYLKSLIYILIAIVIFISVVEHKIGRASCRERVSSPV